MSRAQPAGKGATPPGHSSPDSPPSVTPPAQALAAARPVRRLNPRKLLLSKWTATEPRHKEKHFLVTRVVEPDPPQGRIELIELQAVHSGRSTTLAWRELTDTLRWHQGWR